MPTLNALLQHGGFKPLAAAVNASGGASGASNARLLWGLGLLTFFLSAILDNLTTTIVMLSVLQRAVPDAELRKLLGAMVVVAANAGGAWTPIGDVTTTMLWLHGQLTPLPTMRDLLLPSLVSLVVPLGLLQVAAPEFQEAGAGLRPAAAAASSSGGSTGAGPATAQQVQERLDLSLALTRAQQLEASSSSSSSSSSSNSSSSISSSGDLSSSSGGSGSAMVAAGDVLAYEEASKRGPLVLGVGLAALLSVPVFKYLTGARDGIMRAACPVASGSRVHEAAWGKRFQPCASRSLAGPAGLPPYMGMLCGLSVLWLLTDALHFGESRGYPRVSDALRKLDIEAIMFFLGELSTAACCKWPVHGVWGMNIGVACGLAPAA